MTERAVFVAALHRLFDSFGDRLATVLAALPIWQERKHEESEIGQEG
jgi:hypothetical protein